MLGQDGVDAVAIGASRDRIDIGARALEIGGHPAAGGVRLLLNELLRGDDHPVLAGKRQELLHTLPADADVARGRERHEWLQQSRTIDRLVAERSDHLRQTKLDHLDLAWLDLAQLQRLAELGSAGHALAQDRKLAALQVLEVLDGVGKVAADDDGRPTETLAHAALVGYQLHRNTAGEGIEQRRGHRRAAELHLVGRKRWQSLGRGFEGDELDI